MKNKMILILALAAILGGGAMWFVPRTVFAQTNTPSAKPKILYYTCPMHPSIRSDKPGNCPECGMKLQAVYADATSTNVARVLPSCNMKGCGGGCCGGF